MKKRFGIHEPIIFPQTRKTDRWGSGAYGAPRGGHTHHGVDFDVKKGSVVCATRAGRVSKIGYPYPPSNPEKGHYRYVEILSGEYRFRYFYIHPIVEMHQTVGIDQPIGVAQGLTKVYPGITDHVHLEIMDMGRTEYFDPADFVEVI